MKPQDMTEQDAQIAMESLMNAEDLQRRKKICLADVHDVFRKWFHIQDMNRIDVVLAVALSRKMEGTPLWLILVAPSGDMKSEQLNALDDGGSATVLVPRLTPKTLVNGFKDKGEFPDLAPKLDGKIMLNPDMGEILQLHPQDKAQVWAQLRDLFDGYAGMKSGAGADIQYRNLRVTFLGASTPAIDEQILIHQSLGTREIIYRPKEIVDMESLMDRVWENEKFETIMRRELKAACQRFLEKTEIRNVEISEQMKSNMKALARYIIVMRASAPADSYSGELRGKVYAERPTRILKQLKRLFVCLKSLDPEYSDEKAFEIVTEVVLSSMDVIRGNVLKLLLNNKEPMTTSAVADHIRIGKKHAKTELFTLWNLAIVKRNIVESTTPYGQTITIQEDWSIDESSELIQNLRDISSGVYVPSLNPIDRVSENSKLYRVSGGLFGVGKTSVEDTSSPKEELKSEEMSNLEDLPEKQRSYERCEKCHKFVPTGTKCQNCEGGN